MRGASNKTRPEKGSLPPLPPDAPLLSISDAASYLRISPAALRKLLDGRPSGNDELGSKLRSWMETLSPHRRYIRREPFMRWLNEKAGVEVPPRETISDFPPLDPPSA